MQLKERKQFLFAKKTLGLRVKFDDFSQQTGHVKMD